MNIFNNSFCNKVNNFLYIFFILNINGLVFINVYIIFFLKNNYFNYLFDFIIFRVWMIK